MALLLATPAAWSQSAADQGGIVLVVTGEGRVTRSGDWGRLIDQWRHQLSEALGEAVAPHPYSEPPPIGRPGILVSVNVSSFRYVAPYVRSIPFAGTRRAALVCSVSVADLQSGGVYYAHSYNERSSGAEGVFQDTTNRQVRMVADAIATDVRQIRTGTVSPRPVAAPSPPQAPALANRAPESSSEKGEEVVFWESVRNSRNPAELLAYLERYPDGSFAPLARLRLRSLGYSEPAK